MSWSGPHPKQRWKLERGSLNFTSASGANRSTNGAGSGGS
jgi:hypothetical protein